MSDDETDPSTEVQAAREKTREALEHIEAMEGSGFWGFVALVVGLVLKGVLWKAAREMPDEAAAGGGENE